MRHQLHLSDADLGPLMGLEVSLEGQHDASWHLASVTVTDEGTGDVAHFPADAWLRGTQASLHLLPGRCVHILMILCSSVAVTDEGTW